MQIDFCIVFVPFRSFRPIRVIVRYEILDKGVTKVLKLDVPRVATLTVDIAYHDIRPLRGTPARLLARPGWRGRGWGL